MFGLKKINKKGSIQDIVFVSIVLLVFAISLLVGFKIVSEFNDEIQDSNAIDKLDVGNYASSSSTTMTGHFSGVLDNTFLFLAIGLGIIILILASLVRVHPVFIGLFFIGLVIIIFVCGILSNIYQEMAANTNLAAQADQLVFTSTILEFLPLIVGIFGFLLMLIMYKLWKNANE